MKKYLSHELIFALYLWGFTLLKPITIASGGLSTLILFCFIIIILGISFYYEPKQKFHLVTYTLIGFVLFFLFIDLLFRPNSYLFQYIYNFMIYGVLSMHFLSRIKDTRRFFKLNAWISLIIFSMYAWDPFFNYRLFSGYMPYGFNLILPAFLGIHIGRKVLKYKFMFPFEIISLFMMGLFANRSTLLGAALLWILIEMFITKNNWQKLVKNSILVSLGTILLLNIVTIIDNLILLTNKFGMYSYSLVKFSQLLHGNTASFSSGRDTLLIQAEAFIEKKDNLLIGSGAGAYQAEYGIYTHNIISDIWIEYGLIGILIIISLIIKSFIKTFNYKSHYNKLLGFYLLVLWFPKLLLSVVWLSDAGFWCFIAYGWMKLNDEKYRG